MIAMPRRTECHRFQPLSSSTSPSFSGHCLSGPISANRSFNHRCHTTVETTITATDRDPRRTLLATDRCHRHRRPSISGPNSCQPRLPLLPLTTLTPSPSSGLPIPTTGLSRGADRWNLLGLPPLPASHLLCSSLAICSHDSGCRLRRHDHRPATKLF